MNLKKIISVKGIMVAAAALLLFACKPEPVAVTGITLNAKELNLQPEETAVLTATVEPKETVYGTIAWSVSPKDTVKLTVDQKKKGTCTVEALIEGKATVTAIVDGLRSVQCPVAVNYKSITNTAFIEALDTRAKDTSGKKVTVGWTKEPDGTVKLTPENLEKIRAVTELYICVYGIAVEERLSDLSGIEYFTGLTYLDCSYNQLTELDVTNNTELTYLDCEDQSISSLDVSQNTKLNQLWCGGNDLADLNITNNTALTTLYCDRNRLAELDITNNTALKELYCGNQTSDGSATQDLALTLTAAQKTTWESKWISSDRNKHVTATVKTTE